MELNASCAPTAELDAPVDSGSAASHRAPVPPAEHPALRRYWLSERRAILWYRRQLHGALQIDLSIEETVEYWEHGPARRWRHAKIQRDGHRQLAEIEKHKYLVSERLGCDVGWNRAAREWVEKYAKIWRDWWEAQPDAVPDVTPFL